MPMAPERELNYYGLIDSPLTNYSFNLMTTTTLPPPKNTVAKVLRELIARSAGYGSLSDVETGINSIRHIYSNLRKMGLNIQDKRDTTTNEFGHPVSFKRRYLFMRDLKKAERIYAKLNKK